MQYQHLTQSIIGSAMRVHSILGNGFQEVIYQRALALEFANNKLPFRREFEMDIFYQKQKIGARRVDFLVAETIMVELKALIQLEDVHLAQAKNYLEVSHKQIGLLINFGARRLEFKRIFNNRPPCLNQDFQDLPD